MIADIAPLLAVNICQLYNTLFPKSIATEKGKEVKRPTAEAVEIPITRPQKKKRIRFNPPFTNNHYVTMSKSKQERTAK